MKFENLSKRFVVFMAALFVVVFAAAAYLAERQSASARSQQLSSRAADASETFSRSLDQAASMASILSFADPARAGCSDALATAFEAMGEAYAFIGVTGPGGQILCAAPAEAMESDVSDRAFVAAQADGGAFGVVAVRLDWLVESLRAGARDGSAGLVVTDPADLVVASTIDAVPVGAHLHAPAPNGIARADLVGNMREVLVREVALGNGTFHVLAVTPERGVLAGALRVLAALALVALLFGLAASLIAVQRMRRGMLAPIQRMLAAAPASESSQTAQEAGVPEDLHRLGQAFDQLSERLKAKTVALDQACELAELGTWTLLPDMESVRTMPNMRAIMGFPEEEEVVRIDAFRERIVPEDREGFDAAVKRAVKEQRMYDAEFRALDADGEVRVFRARTGPSGAAPDETHGGISGIIQDITDLRRKETELVRSLRLEHLAGEAAHVGGWRYSITTREFSGTPEAAGLVGLEGGWDPSIEEATERFEDEADRARFVRSFWTCVGTGTRFDEIAKFRKFNGEETWLRVIGEAERDESGKIVSVYGAMQDVRELIGARRATEQLQERLRTILDSLGDGFVIHDHVGSIQYMNRKAHTILGVQDLNLVGGNIWQDLPWAAGSRFEQVVSDALEAGESRNFEGEIGMAGHWIAVAVHPTPAGVAIYLNDVTEERDFRERLRLLDDAVSRLNDVVLVTDAADLDPPGPRIIFVNDAFVRMTGFSREEALGASPRILQGPDTEKDRLRQIRVAIEDHRPVRTELTNYRKDGTRFTSEIDINPLFDAAGECTHFVSVQRDTTERRDNEERMRASEEQFRLASMASRDIIWDWDMHTGIIWNSDNSEELLGPIAQWHVENVLDRRIENVLERIHPDDRLKITESLDTALAGDAESWHCEYRVRTQDGAWRHMTDKAFILRDEEGAPRRMVGAMSDVTDLRLLDAQLHQAQKLETVGQLTGGIAHDFNNLLTIILGNCDIALDDIDEDSALRPLIQSIEEAAERGARVSTDLLAFSRRQPLDPRPTDINKLIRRSSSLFDRAVDASVDLQYDLTDAPTVSFVDPGKLQAALLNLVINAMAAVKPDGRITVRTRSAMVAEGDLPADCDPGAYIEIDVVDNGSGMVPEVVGHAFEPFFTTKKPGVGTGMGLSSVYGLVKQSGGHASIASQPEKGTTVTLSLPATEEAEAVEQEEGPKVPNAGAGQRILVVEDDAELRSYVRTMLGRIGYRVVEAESGAIALEILEQDGDFDLIFTDIVMPGVVNGVQLARKAKKLHPGIRILFTSGYARDALPKERQAPRDIPLLYKPFRTIDLAQRVQDVLANEAAPKR